jgi:putative FmdB family regulatory protein
VPTYQYACTECGHELEAVQKFTDDALTQCPDCTGRLRKVFSAVGVVFKGSGFYRTDSRGKSSSSEAGSDSKSASKSDGGDSAPATKSDSGSAKKTGSESAGGGEKAGAGSAGGSKKAGGESAA